MIGFYLNVKFFLFFDYLYYKHGRSSNIIHRDNKIVYRIYMKCDYILLFAISRYCISYLDKLKSLYCFGELISFYYHKAHHEEVKDTSSKILLNKLCIGHSFIVKIVLLSKPLLNFNKKDIT